MPSDLRSTAALALSGACLAATQFALTREFVSVLYGEEVVVVLVGLGSALAMSAGYTLAGRLGPGRRDRWLAASAGAQLVFPWGARAVCALVAPLPGGVVMQVGVLAAASLALIAPLTMLLPAIVEQGQGAERRAAYTAEVLGFLAGMLLVAACFNRSPLWLAAAQRLMALGLLSLVVSRRLAVGYAAVAAAALAAQPGLGRWSSELLYQRQHRVAGASVLHSIDSPYQRVEVVESPTRGRSLYLDGLATLNTTDLSQLNRYIGQVPARLTAPARALILGNGSLSLVPPVAAQAGFVDVVELDSGVLDAGLRFFTSPAVLKALPNHRLLVDDGKHFLASGGQPYDLIVLDVPSPLSIQEALLHTEEFFALARSRMAPRGVLGVQLSGPLRTNNRTPARVVAALRRVFDDVMVVESTAADRSFAYASPALPFDEEQLRAVAQEKSLRTYRGESVDRRLIKARPLRVDGLDLVLWRGLERVKERLGAS